MTETLVGVDMTEEFAKRFLSSLAPSKDRATLVGLSGDLGSGKTTFVKYLARLLSVEQEVVSPTFVLAKYYDLTGKEWRHLVHIDGYRIDDPNEVGVLKWEDMIGDKDNIIFFEWPERIGARFPGDAAMLHFEFVDEETRNVTFS